MIVAKKKLLFFLADEQNRCYSVEGGVVTKSALPTFLKENPSAWKDMTLQFGTNEKYFSTLRSFSNSVRFVADGQQIIADRMINGKGTEEVMYLIILTQDNSFGLNGYRLEYKSRLDFSKFNGVVRTGIGMNTLQDDVFSVVQATESAVYSIPCNSSNPAAVKALFDGTLLQDKLNFQVLEVQMLEPDVAHPFFAIPTVFINNEGDNSGVFYNSQNLENFDNPDEYVSYVSNNNFTLQFTDDGQVNITGTYAFKLAIIPPFSYVKIFYMKSTQNYPVPEEQKVVEYTYAELGPIFDIDKIYSTTYNLTFDLLAGEKVFFIAEFAGSYMTPIQNNFAIRFSSKNSPSVAYGLRPLDLLKQLVSLSTKGKYTADSEFLKNNNRKVIFSGSSLRGFQDAQIQTTFSDFFQAFTSAYNMGVTVRKGVLFVEPIEDIYNNDKLLLDLGDVSEVSLTVAEKFIYTSAKFGYVKQTYNKRNGRFEYNCVHNYSFPIFTVPNVLNKISPYRADSFGAEFIRTNYPNLDSTDDKGDKDVFAIMISDTVGQLDGEVSTAVSVSVQTIIIAAPVIKSPFSNTVIYNDRPTISGLAQPNKTITVYVDGVIDGQTLSDFEGKWSYQVVTPLESLSDTSNGVHFIEANAQTDINNISSFSKPLTITINTMVQSAFLITSPTNNDTLYNNLPIISGIAPAGKIITILIDSVVITTVTANSSGIWSYQVIAAIPDGNHVITATAPAITDAPSVTISVNKNVSSPLITSLTYGDIIYDNTPLIKGVAIPGTVVPVYVDGGGGPIVSGDPTPLGTVVADVNGDWDFQVTDVVDPNGNTTPYVTDGLHVFSTTPAPVNVLAAISGYKLMRGSNKGPVMDYDAIKLDDQYIPIGVDPSSLPATQGQFLHPETLYNIEETTPLRMLRAHDSIIKPFMQNQPTESVEFNGAEVNANLVTKKDGVVFNEGANVTSSEISPGIFRPFYINFKCKVPDTFSNIMQQIDNNGYISMRINGTDIYALPIGNMTMKIATNEAQTWKLLVSSKTPLQSLIQIFSNGVSLNIGSKMIYISDKNPFHFVKYNYTPPAGFHFKDIYDDFDKNRFDLWITQPHYSQPFQFNDITIPVQVITNNVGDIQLQMISVQTGALVNTFPMTSVASPVQLPNVLKQCSIDLSVGYQPGEYWFAMVVGGTIVAISQKIDLQTDHYDSLAFDTAGSKDLVDFYYSTGIKPRIRVQAKLGKWIPESEIDNYEDEMGDVETTRAIALKMRTLQIGTQTSLVPDWMGLKMNAITMQSNCKIDGVKYTRSSSKDFEEQDLGPGNPLGMYKTKIVLADNETGTQFSTPEDVADVHTTDYVLDATGFGGNSGVINITAENE